MKPKIISKHIIERLSSLEFVQLANFSAMENSDSFCSLINKAVLAVQYSISDDPSLSQAITPEEIKSQVIRYLEQKINAERASYQRFNYETANGFSQAISIAESIKAMTSRKIVPTVVTLNREHAEIFLKNYETNIERGEKYLVVMQKRIDALKDEVDLSPAQAQILQTYNEKKEELRLQKEAVEQIKGSAATVTILFPPFTHYAALSNAQLWKIKELNLSGDKNNPLRDSQKFIRLLMLQQKRLWGAIANIPPELYNIEKIEKILLNLKVNAVLADVYQAFLERLVSNLVDALNAAPLKFPLSQKEAQIIEAFLNVKQIISKTRLAVTAKTTTLLNSHSTEHLMELLEDSSKIHHQANLYQVSKAVSKISKHLTAHEHDFLYLFDKIVLNNRVATNNERAQLSLMLERSVGNLDLNTRLDSFVRVKGVLPKRYQYAILDIKYFSYKSKSNPDYNAFLLHKCEKKLQTIAEGHTIDPKEKMTLYEMGRLEDLAKLKESMDKFNELGLIAPSRKLKKLYEQVNKAATLLQQIELLASDDEIYRSGDILMNHSQRSLTLKDKTGDNETVLTHTFISKYGHAAQIYIDSESGKPKLSHIYGSYESNDVRFTDSVMSEVFRVDPMKLISDEMLQKLEAHYKELGLDYREEIIKLFEQNVQTLHESNQERFADIKNDKPARFKAGLADFGFYDGHVSNQPNDTDAVHAEMYRTDGTVKIRNKMICSEFVARSLVAALYETNKNLSERLGVDDSEHVIKIPLEKENLHRIHPERLISILYEQGCLEEVRRHTVLQKLINHEVLVKKYDKKIVKTPGEIFYNKLIALGKKFPDDVDLFKVNAVLACQLYAEREQLGIDFNDLKLVEFLDSKFGKMHQKLNDDPGVIISFFRAFAEFLGFKPQAQKKVEAMLSSLEGMYVESIKSKYAVELPQSSLDSAPKSRPSKGGFFCGKKEDSPESPKPSEQQRTDTEVSPIR